MEESHWQQISLYSRVLYRYHDVFSVCSLTSLSCPRLSTSSSDYSRAKPVSDDRPTYRVTLDFQFPRADRSAYSGIHERETIHRCPVEKVSIARRRLRLFRHFLTRIFIYARSAVREKRRKVGNGRYTEVQLPTCLEFLRGPRTRNVCAPRNYARRQQPTHALLLRNLWQRRR